MTNRWNWAIAVNTAPRPQPTLERTLASLQAAGFGAPSVIVEDKSREGAWPTWFTALRNLTEQFPHATAYLTLQDDVIFCKGLREYFERTLWPAGNTALCSPYSPGPYRQDSNGWHLQNRGWNLVAALCWAIPPVTARRMVAELSSIESFCHVDAIVGRWASQVGFNCWYHTPSLAQHIGLKNSALGDDLVSDLRQARDFIGEEAFP